jgi:hypothetical protein
MVGGTSFHRKIQKSELWSEMQEREKILLRKKKRAAQLVH